jgi:DNA-binding NarL/FixJ family response regulator
MRRGAQTATLYSIQFRILIVDDNPGFLTAARYLLERDGQDVVATATTAAEALLAVHQHRPNVALVDVMLGSESGLELARLLGDGSVSVILISTHDEADLFDLIAESPAAGFVAKGELSADAIRRLLETH